MSKLFSLASLSLVAGLAATGQAAFALEPSGTTVAVVQSAAAAGAGGRRVLQVQGPVFMGDRVQTGSVGEAQIQFRDNTRLVVGPNSLVTIDSFVFDANNTAQKISMNAVRGAFRFVTGTSRKQAYSIATPTATLGVRGTQFDLAVRGNGETSLALFEGAALLCIRGGRCYEIRGGCAVVVVPPGGALQPVSAGPQRTARLRALFPFVVSQARLQPQFRVDTSNCGVRSAALQPREESQRPFERSLETPDLSAPESVSPGVSAPDRPPSEPSVDRPSTPDVVDQPDPPETGGRPGHGFGDPNHGAGPPGLAGREFPGQGQGLAGGEPSGLAGRD